jgi:crotonobetaine/carnitine-CoA ligase
MTEASSLTSINEDGHIGSVGKPAPYFNVRIVDAEGADKDVDQKGEIVVKELEEGLLTPGYFRNEEATSSTIREGWLFTGDLGYFDRSGYLYYAGRVKDSIRRRGENISAWEIERVVEQLSFVEQAAAIGVPDELGDEAIKVFVKLAQAVQVESPVVSVHHWCLERLPDFQVPAYIVIIDEFPMTGTERIRKELLPTDTVGMEELSRK